MLEIQDLSVSYGGLAALRGVSLTVDEGQFVAIVGPNGAGKTTLFKAISGTVAPVSGSILFEGRDLLAVPPPERAHLGIAHVPEGRQVFASMTVLENLEMGAYSTRGRVEWHRNIDRILTLFPVLAERRKQLAGTLSGGEQQMLAIARGLMAQPKILMFDEPSLGLSPLFTQNLFEIIRALKRDGLTMLLVEQNVQMSLAISDFAYVFSHGKVAIEGPARTVREMPEVRKAYLGL
ncbi:MAG: ABC transporter ATP-binding protein [Alphaproteobacteria bacterium]|nr:MAG: ABC transporter ATP-binding protein [Alphaproteobacteria bacterium]